MRYTVKKIPGPLPWKVVRYHQTGVNDMPKRCMLFADRNGLYFPVEHCSTFEIAVITAIYRGRCDA